MSEGPAMIAHRIVDALDFWRNPVEVVESVRHDASCTEHQVIVGLPLYRAPCHHISGETSLRGNLATLRRSTGKSGGAGRLFTN